MQIFCCYCSCTAERFSESEPFQCGRIAKVDIQSGRPWKRRPPSPLSPLFPDEEAAY